MQADRTHSSTPSKKVHVLRQLTHTWAMEEMEAAAVAALEGAQAHTRPRGARCSTHIPADLCVPAYRVTHVIPEWGVRDSVDGTRQPRQGAVHGPASERGDEAGCLRRFAASDGRRHTPDAGNVESATAERVESRRGQRSSQHPDLFSQRQKGHEQPELPGALPHRASQPVRARAPPPGTSEPEPHSHQQQALAAMKMPCLAMIHLEIPLIRSCSIHIFSRIAALSFLDILFVAFPKSSTRVTTCARRSCWFCSDLFAERGSSGREYFPIANCRG